MVRISIDILIAIFACLTRPQLAILEPVVRLRRRDPVSGKECHYSFIQKYFPNAPFVAFDLESHFDAEPSKFQRIMNMPWEEEDIDENVSLRIGI